MSEGQGQQNPSAQPDATAAQLAQLSQQMQAALQQNQQIAAATRALAERQDAIVQQMAPKPPTMDVDEAGKKLHEEFFRNPVRYEANAMQTVLNEAQKRDEQTKYEVIETLRNDIRFNNFWQMNPDLAPWQAMVHDFTMRSQQPTFDGKLAEAAAATRQMVFSTAEAIKATQSQEEEMRRRMASSGAYGGGGAPAFARAPVDQQSRVEQMHAAVDADVELQRQRMQRNWKVQSAA